MRRTQTSSTCTSATCEKRSTARLTDGTSRPCAEWGTGSWQRPTTLRGTLQSPIRDDDPHVCSPRRPVRRVGVTAVCVPDRAHDRQAESRSTPDPPWVGAGEALERLILEARREARPCVLDVQLNALLVCRGSQRHLASAVADGVVDEVAERLLEPIRVARKSHFIRNDHLDRRVLGSETVAHSAQQLGDVDLDAADGQRCFVRACENEHVIGERRETVDLVIGRSKRVTQLLRRALTAQRELELRL